jgi:hypothetical protein
VSDDQPKSNEVEEVEGDPFRSIGGYAMNMPPPISFAEGQRYIYGVLAAAAGMFCGAASAIMVALLMWGGWSRSEEHTIVTIFGWSLGGFIAAMIVVIVGLLAGGPVGRLKVVASKDGATIEADGQ